MWTMAPDGSDLVQVTSGTHDHREPAWSPDGRKIAFSSDRAGSGNSDIWTVDRTAGIYEQRTSGATNEHSPAWAPDGASIAYADGRLRGGCRRRASSAGERPKRERPSAGVGARGVLSYYHQHPAVPTVAASPLAPDAAGAGSRNVAAPVSARSSGRPTTTSAWERSASALGCPQRATKLRQVLSENPVRMDSTRARRSRKKNRHDRRARK